jgi:hypothetical protein
MLIYKLRLLLVDSIISLRRNTQEELDQTKKEMSSLKVMSFPPAEKHH